MLGETESASCNCLVGFCRDSMIWTKGMVACPSGHIHEVVQLNTMNQIDEGGLRRGNPIKLAPSTHMCVQYECSNLANIGKNKHRISIKQAIEQASNKHQISTK